MSELLHQLRWAIPIRAVGWLTNWMPDNRVTVRLRGWLARPFIRSCGENLWLGSDVTLLNPHQLVLGDHVYIAHGSWLNAMGGLTLEDEVVLGPYVVISTLQHVFSNGSVRFGGSKAAPVRIGRGSWLAGHVSVKCGVSIGRSTLIAANACVVKDVPDAVMVGGVPGEILGPNVDGQAEFTDRRELSTPTR